MWYASIRILLEFVRIRHHNDGMYRTIRRYGLLLVVVVAGVVFFGWLIDRVLLAGLMVEVRSLPVVGILTTARPPLPDTTPYARLDPAVIEVLEPVYPSAGGATPGMLPLGVYMPRVPDLRPTATPTLPPPTFTATPTPTVTATLTPTATTASESSIPTRTPTREIILPTVPPDVLANIMRPLPTADPLVDCAPDGRMPMAGRLVQRFYGSHTGIDLSAPVGTPIMVTHSGTVQFAGWNEFGYGILVIVENGPFITYYAHQSAVNVRAGDFVRRGTIIGFSGNTGNSSGPHLHYEIRIDDVPVDPLTFTRRAHRVC